MELELSRIDYTIVGLTVSHCLKLLPATFTKEPQKVVVGDADGVVQIFSIKKQDVQLHFKALPGPKIASIQLGGPLDSPYDTIFVASESEVRAYTKKGKLFLNFDSGMTEPISTMYSIGSDLFLCGKHVYNHFRDCKDLGSYLCGDKIVDVIAFYTERSRRLISLIACEGRMIRALEHSRVTLTMEIESSPTILHIYQNDDIRMILFGTTDGKIGILDVENKHGLDRWLICSEKYTNIISAIDSYDMMNSGTKQIILGRQDGNIEVYVINPIDDMHKPEIIYQTNCNESVTAISCGVVGTQGFDEILVATYTGRIFGLTTEPIDKNIGGDISTGNFVYSQETSQKIAKLKTEIDELQMKVVKERENYQNSTQSMFEQVSAMPLIEVKDTFILSRETATYTLTIEVPMAIDNILLQSNVQIDLLDTKNNSAVVSYSHANPEEGNYLLATYRCQINTNRLEIKIRTVEGFYGVLNAYVTPLIQPKCSRLKKYEIKPLSLHFRIYQEDHNRFFNLLTIKGSYSLIEIHHWLSQCLPEIPEKPSTIDKNIFLFKSTFTESILRCTYQKGEALFESDNISTIAILKDFLTNEATKKKIKIDLSLTISDDSIGHMLKLLEPQLLKQQDNVKKMQILNALNEFEINDGEIIKHLSNKYRNLLNNRDEILRNAENETGLLPRIYGVINNLYLDYNKFKGFNVKSKLTKLYKLLENYLYDELIEFFQPNLKTTEE